MKILTNNLDLNRVDVLSCSLEVIKIRKKKLTVIGTHFSKNAETFFPSNFFI